MHWNQDEDFGGFGGPHCMVPGGYGAVTDALARLLPGLRLSTPVAGVEDTDSGVKVTTASGVCPGAPFAPLPAAIHMRSTGVPAQRSSLMAPR